MVAMERKIEGIVYDITTVALKIEGAYSQLNDMFKHVGKHQDKQYGMFSNIEMSHISE